MTTKDSVQYGLWQEPGADDENGYWCLYESLADAIRESDGEEIYEFKPKCLGRYKLKESAVKIRDKKKS